MKIYVAGPYSAPTHGERVENTMAAVDAGIRLLEAGHEPFIPHLTHFVNERAKDRGIEISYEEWLEYDEQWLYDCEAILHLASSNGADQERNVAEDIGLKIYDDISEVSEVA